jgi:hypothetical protein
VRHRVSYSSVVATLALVLAIGGPAAAGAQLLLTGRNVKDDSLTGADIQNDSLTGADIRDGSLGSNLLSTIARANLRGATGPAGPKGETGATGATGTQGPAGAGITADVVKGDDVANYQNGDTLATGHLPVVGDYVIFANITAHNTGLADDDLNCGLFMNGQGVGGGGVSVVAGDTASGSTVGAISATAPADITLKCYSNHGTTTFDLSNITLRIHNFG